MILSLHFSEITLEAWSENGTEKRTVGSFGVDSSSSNGNRKGGIYGRTVELVAAAGHGAWLVTGFGGVGAGDNEGSCFLHKDGVIELENTGWEGRG